MFSDHLSPLKPSRIRPWLIVGAAALMVCQLVALGWLAGGQVDRAQTRVATEVAERERVAQCIESSAGATRYLCNRKNGADTFASQPGNALNAPTVSAREKSVLGGLIPAAGHRAGLNAGGYAPTLLSKN